jgi:hypothetical protein
MSLVPVRELCERAQRAAVSMRIRQETHQSFPIPVRREGRPSLLFLYSVARIEVGVGFMLYAPHLMMAVDPSGGGHGTLEKLVPREHGVPDEEQKPLGYSNKQRPRLPEAADQKKLLEVYDLVLPNYYAGRGLPPQGIEAAKELVRLFFEVTEDVLEPYYRTFGADFFRWLSQFTPVPPPRSSP